MTGTDTKPCAGCGKPTTGMCWTDCGMSLCGAPLCGECQHVDEKYGWRHEPKEQNPLFIGVDLSSQPDMTAATVVLSPEALAALPEVQALIRQAVEAERERIITGLRDEADVIPCSEDAMVTKGCADLIEADFSYDEAERIAAIRKRGEG